LTRLIVRHLARHQQVNLAAMVLAVREALVRVGLRGHRQARRRNALDGLAVLQEADHVVDAIRVPTTRAQTGQIEVLHHEEVRLALAADVVARADVRMGESRDDTGLALEALAQPGIGGEISRQYLDGDRTIEAGVARFVDFAIPPAPRSD